MHIEVEDIIENGDGSATLKLDMGPDAIEALLSFAVIEAIKNGIEMHKNQTEDYANSLQLELDL
jgi:hypothetical protein